MAKRTKSSGSELLTCIDCGKAERFQAASPAAPILTASEESEKKGWSFSVGFFAMLTGNHENRCPDCTKRAKQTASEAKGKIDPVAAAASEAK